MHFVREKTDKKPFLKKIGFSCSPFSPYIQKYTQNAELSLGGKVVDC